MESTVLTALITGAFSVLAVIITNWSSNKSIDAKLDKQQAVLEERINHLTERVEKHNNLIERTYKLEAKVDAIIRKD